MSDDAAVVGVGSGFWAAACSHCDWIYSGQCREVDSASRAHCKSCGGDVVAMTNPGREVTLRLERDILGRVVAGSPTTLLTNDPSPEVYENPQDALAAYAERISRPEYWKGIADNKSGFEEN